MRRLFLLLITTLLACSAYATRYTIKTIPNVQLSDSTRMVSNPDNILSPQAVATIDSILLDIRRTTTCQVAAVIVNEVDSEEIERFATKLFNEWGIGNKSNDNGILVLVTLQPHTATIRTGDGAEGILPDIVAGHITYDTMVPYFRNDDYDGGMIAGAREIHRITTDPAVRTEIVAQVKAERKKNLTNFVMYYLLAALAVTALLMFFFWRAIQPKNGKELTPWEKYYASDSVLSTAKVISTFFLGIPMLTALAIWRLRRKWRDGPRNCSVCNTPMHKLDEEADNAYLNSGQNIEELIGSVDYDVWLCPDCGNTEILRYAKGGKYTACRFCNAVTASLAADRVIRSATTFASGEGMRTYHCAHCGRDFTTTYIIPRVSTSGGGGSSSGGGGGSWGGGHSSGGGATARW